MDWLKPSALAAAMTEAGTRKARLPAKTIIVTGILSGMFLGFTTTLYLSAVVASGSTLVGAVFFPVGFIMLVLLGLELFTGNAALRPYARLAGRLSRGQVIVGLVLVYFANLIGAVVITAIGLYAGFGATASAEPEGLATAAE